MMTMTLGFSAAMALGAEKERGRESARGRRRERRCMGESGMIGGGVEAGCSFTVSEDRDFINFATPRN
jgi:hypothetical protein